MICCFENKQCYKVHILEHSLEVANYITTWCFSRENMTQKRSLKKDKICFAQKKIQIQSDAYQRVGGNLFNFTVENDAHHNSASSAYGISSGMSPS